MADTIFTPGFQFYQSANADAERIKDNFLVRLNEFDVIIDDLRRQPKSGSVQHFLLIGRRGSGKSTLLRRLQIELEVDPDLAKKYLTINLAEEQANIYKLFDLLEAIVDELDFHEVNVKAPSWKDDTHQYARDLFSAIHDSLQHSGKKLVLLLDNIDRIFENLGDDASLLREYLLNYDDLKIIGGSTKMTEHFWKYNEPFYQFFRVLELKPLTSHEMRTLLLNWSDRLQLPELKEFVQNKPGQLETVRLLTDGLPRTLQFFVNILLTRTQETGYEYLRLIMDSVTPLYQERLNTLPPAQRKIVLQMAFLWESAGAKEISEVTKMDTKLISAQLKQLAEKGLVDKIETGVKNHLYRLSERFFNLWLIFTQGSPKEKRKAKCLTVFLENFYDAQEIMRIATAHLEYLEHGNPVANKAALITKALAQSRHISFYIRDKLIDSTLVLSDMAMELRLQLPPTTEQISKEIEDAIQKGDFAKAHRIAGQIEHEDGYREFQQGYVYQRQRQNLEAQKYYQQAYNKSFTSCAVILGKLYAINNRPVEAEKYLRDALAQNLSNAAYSLAEFYKRQKNFGEAELHFLQALKENNWRAAGELGRIYFQTGDVVKSEEFYSIAIDHNVLGSALGLAVTYYFQNKNQERVVELIELEKSWHDLAQPYLELFSIVFDTWKGRLVDILPRIENILNDVAPEHITVFLVLLMVHYQVNLVNQIFEHGIYGDKVKEDNWVLYFTALLLSGREQTADLKIPPELKEVVADQVEGILKIREIFYPVSKL